MTKVTIISPTYNHEPYIAECIDSVLRQKFQDWEMIIVNDGSSDNTEREIKKYKDPRIKYFYQDNKGIMRLGETYNKILNMASGEICAILECDDYWPADKLETIVPLFEDSEVVLAYGISRLVTADSEERGLTIPSVDLLKRYPSSVFLNNPIGTATCLMARSDVRTFTFPCSVMIRTSTLKKIGGFISVPDMPFIDYPTFMEIGLQGKYSFVPRTMGYWRQHINSNTQTRDDHVTDILTRDFTFKFLEKNKISLPMSQFEFEAIKQSWSTLLQENNLKRGRKLLLAGQWAQARLAFNNTIAKERRLGRVIAALAGIVACYFHRDIEFIYRLTGRVTFDDLTPRKTRIKRPVVNEKAKINDGK